TRTACPCIRAGRNSTLRIHARAGVLKAGLGLATISIEPGSARPKVSTMAASTTRPWIPARMRRGGFRDGREGDDGRRVYLRPHPQVPDFGALGDDRRAPVIHAARGELMHYLSCACRGRGE